MEEAPEQGEERRRRVRKKRRVTRVTVGGKEIKGDILKNPSSLEFPDPVRPWRKVLIVLILLALVGGSALLFTKMGDWMPRGGSGGSGPSFTPSR